MAVRAPLEGARATAEGRAGDGPSSTRRASHASPPAALEVVAIVFKMFRDMPRDRWRTTERTRIVLAMAGELKGEE